MTAGVGVSKEVKDEAMRLYVEEDLSTAEVAQRLGMSQSWVSTLRKERGIAVRPRGRRLDHERIIRLYLDEGQTVADLAARERVDSTRIRQLLVDHGVRPVSISERLTKIDADQVRQLYVNERLTIPEVADRLGVSSSGVQQAMERHNISTRSAVALNVTRSELEAWLAEGLSNAEIAEQQGVTTWRITKKIRELGLRRPSAAPQHEAPPAGELVHKYVVEQQPITGLSEYYGTTHSTVRAWLHQAGVTINEGRQGTANRRDSDLTGQELQQLYIGQELTAAEIAAQIGVTKNVVLVMLHSNGIALRPPGAMRPGHQLPLLDRLHRDSTITDTLKRHNVPPRTGLWITCRALPKSTRVDARTDR